MEENDDVEIINYEPKYGESLDDMPLRENDYVDNLYVYYSASIDEGGRNFVNAPSKEEGDNYAT